MQTCDGTLSLPLSSHLLYLSTEVKYLGSLVTQHTLFLSNKLTLWASLRWVPTSHTGGFPN